jgi:hypothetical protein
MKILSLTILVIMILEIRRSISADWTNLRLRDGSQIWNRIKMLYDLALNLDITI